MAWLLELGEPGFGGPQNPRGMAQYSVQESEEMDRAPLT